MWYFQGKYIEVSFDFKGDTTGGAISNCKYLLDFKNTSIVLQLLLSRFPKTTSHLEQMFSFTSRLLSIFMLSKQRQVSCGGSWRRLFGETSPEVFAFFQRSDAPRQTPAKDLLAQMPKRAWYSMGNGNLDQNQTSGMPKFTEEATKSKTIRNFVSIATFSPGFRSNLFSFFRLAGEGIVVRSSLGGK